MRASYSKANKTAIKIRKINEDEKEPMDVCRHFI